MSLFFYLHGDAQHQLAVCPDVRPAETRFFTARNWFAARRVGYGVAITPLPESDTSLQFDTVNVIVSTSLPPMKLTFCVMVCWPFVTVAEFQAFATVELPP